MADTAVTERRIRPILEALQNGNQKQALKECEKWQKKGEASDRFLALKASILLRSTDEKQQKKGFEETFQLCHRPIPVLNFEAIHQLQESLKLMKLEATEGSKLWERAVAARPNDEELVTTWLNNSISASNWQNAQKATMALRKAFPKERKYDYWNILMCYLISQDSKLQAKDRNLFGTLANRMITKAARDQGEKAISNIEELGLLAAVLRKTGSTSEFLQLVESDSLQAIVAQDRSTTESLILEATDATFDDPSVRDKRPSFLRFEDAAEAPHSQDDRIWSLFVRSARSNGVWRTRIQQIDELLERSPDHRQARLAKIDLLTSDQGGSSEPLPPLLDACMEYYKLFGTKPFCFDDLIARLRPRGVAVVYAFEKRFTAETADAASTTQRLFALKLKYNLLFEEDASVLRVLSFVSKALKLYSGAINDFSVAPQSALLAASALLRLAARSGIASYTMQACMILKTTCSQFNDYYPLRMLLLQVQLISGQIHLGMDNAIHLSIKNLQWETLGHFILTRISTLHPQQYGQGEDTMSPLGVLDTALSVFKNSQKSLDRAIRDGLKYGSYSNVIDTVKLRDNLQTSIVRQLYRIEQRKCQRALDQPVVPYQLYEGELHDLRDTSFMPDFGVEDQELQTLLQCGPRPQQGWFDAMTMHECLMAYLLAELAAPYPDIIIMALESLEKAAPKASADAGDLTADEQQACSIYQDLTAIALQVWRKEPSNALKLGAVIARIKDSEQTMKPASINGVEYPDWRYLHHWLVKLEVLQSMAHFSAILLRKFKTEKDKNKAALTSELKKSLDEVRPMIDEQAKNVYDGVKKLKEQLNASGVLGKLVDVMLGRVDEAKSAEQKAFAERMANLQDEAAVEEYCGAMRESWEDALDGILAVKIKTV